MRTSITAVVSCLVLSGFPLAAGAAGLGKVVVFSALGQPLRAEIEVSATRDELSGMKAQLASPETFKQSGVDYSTTLLGIRFSLEKRANGQSVIKLSSDSPINDPFIDMLLELNWPAGRLVREYTFLLDPPQMATKAPAPVASATSRPTAVSRQPVAGGTANPAIDDEVRIKAAATVRSQTSAAAEAAQRRSAASSASRSQAPGADAKDTYEVKRGDTLGKIARQTRPEGVSLEQMLIGLLRGNQDAFDGGNMNRLKAGKILAVPEKSVIEAVTTSEAKKVVVAQAADWNAYRGKLASAAAQAPVRDTPATQQASGKITPKVEDRAASSGEAKDQLKVSKTEAGGAAAGAAAKRSAEDRMASEKALKEASERQIALEKNVADLQKLVELKNQNLAELQKQAAAKAAPIEAKPPAPPAPVAVVAPPAPPAPAAVVVPPAPPAVPVTPPVVSEPPVPAPVVTPPPVTAVAPQPAAVTPVAPAPAPLPEPAPVAKAKVVPPPPPEPGLIEELLSYPLALAGGALALLLAAYLLIRRRRANADSETPLDLSSSLSLQGSSLTANSVFRSTGGQSVDTSHAPAQTDFSQAGPGSIDTDEVDPVAEADVYMAYGRDAQAEEILLEAKQKDPRRYAIHLKLLEIYVNRRNMKQFEALAADLYSETGGNGADWQKAAAMGAQLDPSNPLFIASAPALPEAEPNRAVITPPSKSTTPVSAAALAATTVVLATARDPLPPPAAIERAGSPGADLTSLDFDLGLGDSPSTLPATPDAAAEPERVEPSAMLSTSANAAALDFDLAPARSLPFNNDPFSTDFSSVTGTGPATASSYDFDLAEPAPSMTVDTVIADFDFDVGMAPPATPATGTQAIGRTIASEETILGNDDGLQFDVKMTESTFLGSALPEPSSFDMSSIDLDLKVPDLTIPESDPPQTEAGLGDIGFEKGQIRTAVNPDFAIMQSETLIYPQAGGRLDVDRDQDFQTTQAVTMINQPFGDAQGPETQFDITPNEEVATKLDLAKAYEEMADFEGARELLHEVVKEGDATQREAAQAILAKIGD